MYKHKYKHKYLIFLKNKSTVIYCINFNTSNAIINLFFFHMRNYISNKLMTNEI